MIIPVAGRIAPNKCFTQQKMAGQLWTSWRVYTDAVLYGHLESVPFRESRHILHKKHIEGSNKVGGTGCIHDADVM